MKLSAGALAGMVLAHTGVVVAEELLFEGRECPVAFEPGGNRFVQSLRSGDSILGPVLIYQWDIPSQDGLTAELVRPDHQIVLMRESVPPHSSYRWEARPGTEIMVPERGEVVFKCSSRDGASAVCFEKLT